MIFPDLTVTSGAEELAHLTALWVCEELTLIEAAHLLQQHSDGFLNRSAATVLLCIHRQVQAADRAARTGATAARLLRTERESS